MTDLVCSVDLGSSRIKAGLFDPHGGLAALAAGPAGGTAVEFDAAACAADVLALIRSAHERAGRPPVAAICLTGQRATSVPLAEDGRPAGPALSWQDTRGGAEFDRFVAGFGAGRYRAITGLPPSHLWTLSKLLGLRRRDPAGFERAARFGLLADYVLFGLGGRQLATDHSSASLTGLYDLATGGWSGPLLEAAGLEPDRLPAVRPAGSFAGELTPAAAAATGLPAGTPLVMGGGDQQCAALGLGVSEPGQAALCLGTAAVLSCPVERPVTAAGPAFFCTAHVVPGRFVLEAIHNSFGSSLRWLGELLGTPAWPEIWALAGRAAPGAGGALFLPFLAGIGTPDFSATARGALVGLSAGSGRAEVARAVCEGLAWEVRRILDALAPWTSIDRIELAGGPAGLTELTRLLARHARRSLFLAPVPEAGLWGAARLAWGALGRPAGGPTETATAATAAGPTRETAAGIRSVAPGPPDPDLEKAYRRYARFAAAVLAASNAAGDPEDVS